MPVRTCRECFEEYVPGPKHVDDGFCSDPCMNQYDREIANGIGKSDLYCYRDEGGEG